MPENINWSVFATSQFWFGIDRFGGVSLTDKIILGFGVVLLAVGIVVLMYRVLSKNVLLKPMIGRVSSVFITVGLLEMFWFLLRNQYVNTLGSRAAALLVALVGLAFLYKPLKYFWKQYGADRQSMEKQQLKDKYLQKR